MLRLRRDLDELGRRDFRNLLKGLVPLRMRDLFVTLTGIPADKPGHQITSAERQRALSSSCATLRADDRGRSGRSPRPSSPRAAWM